MLKDSKEKNSKATNAGWMSGQYIIHREKKTKTERETEKETKKFCQKQWAEDSAIKLMKRE